MSEDYQRCHVCVEHFLMINKVGDGLAESIYEHLH